MSEKVTKFEPRDKEKEVIKTFDTKFIHLLEVASTKVKTLHDAQMFRKICENIKGYLKKNYEKIKELRTCLIEGKMDYGKCVLAHTFIKDILYFVNIKLKELETLVSEL